MNLKLHFKYGGKFHALHKILLIMKLVIIILTAAILQVSASTYAQKITLKRTNAPLETVIKEIRKQSGYYFIYTLDQLKEAKPVTINVANKDLDDVLAICFKDQPFTYTLKDQTVVVKEKEPSFLGNVKAVLSTIDVRGKIVDKNGEPLAGATIKVKGTTTATTSDSKGDFYLPKVDDGAILIITFIGFAPLEVSASADLTAIKLKDVDAKLNEIQIIAYGTTSKKFSTGNIGNISGEDIAKQPVTNPLLTMVGRVPGLSIQQTSGNTLGNVSVTVQGLNSIGNGNDPFYVIDGVPYAPGIPASIVGSTIPALNKDVGSAFNFINPSDVESVQILKDADATAIYGSRAANGAILITTKKGKAGQTKVTLNMQSGAGKITRKLNVLTAGDYLSMRKEAYKNDGLAIPNSATTATNSNYDLTVWDQNKNTDWQDVLVGGTAKYTNVQATISGGSTNTQFLAGGGYNRQTTVYPGDLADVKENVHFNLNHSSENNKFKFNITSTYVQDNNELPGGGDLMTYAVKMAPNSPNLFKPDGSLNWQPNPLKPTVSTFDNPLKWEERKFNATTNNLITNGLVSYQLYPGLTIKGSAGYTRQESHEILTLPTTFFKPETIGVTASSSFLNRYNDSYILEPQITYSNENRYGSFDFLLGTTFQQSKLNVQGIDASDFSNNLQLDNISSAATLRPGQSLQSVYKYNALFARLNYRFLDKYIINLTARRDGSSRFGDENKLHNFYSIGGAWLFGSEDFIKKNLPFLSQGKLRLNYGTTGNDQIGDYSYLSTLSTYVVGVPYQSSVGLQANAHANPSLQWEETSKFNIGLDMGFFGNKLSFSGNYFRNRSSNQLIAYPLSVITGFSSVIENLPATVQNTGIELQLDALIANSDSFSWRASFNATIPRNKLVAFPGLENTGYAADFVIGQPINIKKTFPYAGVNSTTGLYEYINSKGERTSDPNYDVDRTVLINTNPKWYGGFSNTFGYKGFQLDFLFQYVNQIGTNAMFVGSSPGFFNANQVTSVLDRWQTAGDIATIQKYSTRSSNSYNQGTYSTGKYSDASFLRLKNASFSYDFSTKKLREIGLTNLRVYLQGQNLLTITKYVGTDPESQLVQKLPPLTMYTLGLQISL